MEEEGEIFISSLNKSFKLKRKIGRLGGGKGPVLIFVGGMHGNEPSGFAALTEVFNYYSDLEHQFNGTAYAFSGNIRALSLGQRFIDQDLNRMWSEERISKVNAGLINGEADSEEMEQMALFQEIKTILQKEEGPFLFFDLHTTSASSPPFVLINDTLINRKLAVKYPHRIILGIEEYLDGPMLSYINDQGYASLGFEAGQHHDPRSYELHKNFILQSFLLTGFLKDKKKYKELIHDQQNSLYAHNFFEVRHCYRISPDEEFKMEPGYLNFSTVNKGQVVAANKHGVLKVKESGYLFMPLYQKKGGEGFYLIKLIPKFWLHISSFIRKIDFEIILLALPGIKRLDSQFKSLLVDEYTARFLVRDVFHLLGYRRVRRQGNKRIYIKREFSNKSINSK